VRRAQRPAPDRHAALDAAAAELSGGYLRQPSIVFRTWGGLMSQATTAFRLR
jgi:hypothetical protein